MSSELKYCKCVDEMVPITSCNCFRRSADEVWDMARKYEALGLYDLADVLKDLSTQIHDLAREQEAKENGDN